MRKSPASILFALLVLVVVMVAVFRSFVTSGDDDSLAEGSTSSTLRNPPHRVPRPVGAVSSQKEGQMSANPEEPTLDLKAAGILLRKLKNERPGSHDLAKPTLELQILETILLFVKRFNPSCDEILALIRSRNEAPPYSFLLTLAFARGFSSDHASWLEALVHAGREAGRVIDSHSLVATDRALAAAHVLRLRHASANLDSLAATVKDWRTSRKEGIWKLATLSALVMHAGSGKSSAVIEDLAQTIMEGDATFPEAEAAVAAMGGRLPQVLHGLAARINSGEETMGAAPCMISGVTDIRYHSLIKGTLALKRTVHWPNRGSAVLGLSSLAAEDSQCLDDFIDLLEHGQTREKIYLSDPELVEYTFKESGNWNHVAGFLRVIDRIEEGSPSQELVTGLVNEFLQKNARIMYGETEYVRAKSATFRFLQELSGPSRAARLGFRTLGRIAAAEDIPRIEQLGRKLGLEADARVAISIVRRYERP